MTNRGREVSVSELTPCNRCTLRWMERRAADRGATVTIEHVSEGPMSGWTSATYSDSEKPSAWFVELPEECAC